MLVFKTILFSPRFIGSSFGVFSSRGEVRPQIGLSGQTGGGQLLKLDIAAMSFSRLVLVLLLLELEQGPVFLLVAQKSFYQFVLARLVLVKGSFSLAYQLFSKHRFLKHASVKLPL